MREMLNLARSPPGNGKKAAGKPKKSRARAIDTKVLNRKSGGRARAASLNCSPPGETEKKPPGNRKKPCARDRHQSVHRKSGGRARAASLNCRPGTLKSRMRCPEN